MIIYFYLLIVVKFILIVNIIDVFIFSGRQIVNPQRESDHFILSKLAKNSCTYKQTDQVGHVAVNEYSFEEIMQILSAAQEQLQKSDKEMLH